MATILIADDSATVRSTVKVHLMGHGFEFLEAEDGSRALRLLRMVPVALAIVDYRMPGLDGIALMERVRSASGISSRVPFILVSSDHDKTLRERALAAGASTFLRKPVNATELVSSVERLVARDVTTEVVLPTSTLHATPMGTSNDAHSHGVAQRDRSTGS